MKTYSSLFFLRLFGFAGAIVLVINACQHKNEKASPVLTYTKGNVDSVLFLESNSASQQFLPYQNVDSIWPSSSASGHSPFFKVRYNAKARSVLGADGKLPIGKTFPEGSIIVKDLYNTKTGPRQLVAIMKKETANPYSDKGWLWSELLDNGGDYVSAKNKGVQCVSCHSVNNRDYTRVFDLF